MVTGGNLELKTENNEWVSDPKEPNRKAHKLGTVQKLRRSRPWWFRPVIQEHYMSKVSLGYRSSSPCLAI